LGNISVNTELDKKVVVRTVVGNIVGNIRGVDSKGHTEEVRMVAGSRDRMIVVVVGTRQTDHNEVVDNKVVNNTGHQKVRTTFFFL
jgi:hypothetical protein